MNKERLVTFTDAVLAIIMTILVLELKRPEHISWGNLWDLRMSFLAYAISFFWLGTMWVNLHGVWDNVVIINNKLVWISILSIFFSSLFPYVTSIVSEDFGNSVAQIVYGIIVLLITFTNIWMYDSIKKTEDSPISKIMQKEHNRLISWDIAIKIVGFILTLTIWPSAMMFAVLVSAIVIIIPRTI